MSILSRLFPKHDAGSTPAGGTPIPAGDGATPMDPGEGEPTPADPLAAAAALPPPAAPARISGSTPTVDSTSPPSTSPARKPRDSHPPKDTVKEASKDSAQRLRSTLIGPAAPALPNAPAPAPTSSRRAHPTTRREKPGSDATSGVAAPAPVNPSDLEASVTAALDQLLATAESPTVATKVLSSAPRLTPTSATPQTAGEPAPATPAWTAADRASARATFEELAREHVRPVRNLMLELEWGGPAAAWMVATRGALASLRRMADQIELTDVSAALTTFLGLLDQAIVDGTLTDDVIRRLQTSYAPLARTLPRAFELGGERDRREPILVQALLGQVPGLEPLLVQRLFAVGLGRLDSLLRATAEEVSVVADLPAPVASALVEKAQELRQINAAPLEITDASRILGPLLAALKRQHNEYARAAQGWTADNLSAKRRHRRERELTFQKIRIAVTRLGDVDFALRLQTYSYARRIDELDQYLQQAGGLARAS